MIPIQLIMRKSVGGSMYGVQRLRDVADPTFTTLIGDPKLHATLPLHNQILPCKSNGNRQVVNYLNTVDWTKNANGSASVLDGSDGLDVMLYNPGGYVIFGGTDPVYERWIVSNRPFTYGADTAMYIPPFLDCPDYCTIDRTTGKSRSIRNETTNFAGTGGGATAGGLGYPRTEISRYGYESASGLKGAGWEGLSYIDTMYTACMMYIEYRTKNLKLSLGAGASNWGNSQWSAFNGYRPVFKMFEAQLALSGTLNGNMTGIYTKHFSFAYNAGTQIYDTPKPIWRGKSRLWGDMWQWQSRIELEVQSAAAGGKSYLYVAYPGTPVDTNRSDSSFAFKNTYKLIGEVPRVEGWVKSIHQNTIAGNVLSGAGETTYACSYNWNSNIPASGVNRRGVLFGANLFGGGDGALGAAISDRAPSGAGASVGGGFRANVSG